MAISPKYYLSTLLLGILTISCSRPQKAISKEEGIRLSKELLDREYMSHNFDGPMQGSPLGMELLDSILKLDPTNASAWREISIPYLKRGIPHEWKPLFDKAVQYDAKTWQPWRGYLYLWFYRDYEKAIADFNASDTLTDYIDHPQGHSVDFWRGVAYLGMEDYENSISYWDKHIHRETEESGEDWVELEAFLYRGIAYYESGNTEKALENFDKVIHYFKQSADAKYFKALILKDKGNKKDALRLTEEALSDFEKGFYNNRPYVETLRQIYLEDLETFKNELLQS